MSSNDAAEAVEAFQRYAQTFQTLDPTAMGRHFHAPSIMVSPDGVFALADEAAVAQAYRRVMEELRRTDYARSVFPGLAGARVSHDLAVVRGDCVWETSGGEEMARFGINYTLRSAHGQWKILAALVYELVDGT